MRVIGLVSTKSPPLPLERVYLLVAVFQCLVPYVAHLLEILTVELLPFRDRPHFQRAHLELEDCILIPNLLVAIVVDTSELRQILLVCGKWLFEELEFVRYQP